LELSYAYTLLVNNSSLVSLGKIFVYDPNAASNKFHLQIKKEA
jgi:hypothetical protein